MNCDELLAEYRNLEEQLLLKWDAPLVNDFFAMIFYGVLSKQCKNKCGDEDGTLQNDLVGGSGKRSCHENNADRHRKKTFHALL